GAGWNGPGLATFTLRLKLPSAFAAVAATKAPPRRSVTRVPATAGERRPLKSIWWPYVVAPGAFSVSTAATRSPCPDRAYAAAGTAIRTAAMTTRRRTDRRVDGNPAVMPLRASTPGR